MTLPDLTEILREKSQEIYALQTEIGCEDASSYETSLKETLEKLSDACREKLEQEKRDVLDRCRSKWEEVSSRFESIGEHFVPRKTFEPPYKQRLSEAEQELEAINLKLASRESAKIKLSNHIKDLCEEMKVNTPPIPRLLTDSAMEECRQIECKSSLERTKRLNEVQDLIQKLSSYCGYLGIHSEYSSESTGIDAESISILQDRCHELKAVVQYRRKEIQELESEITEIATLLGIAPELPSTLEGAGTAHRLQLLKTRLQELATLKIEKISELVAALRVQLENMWEDLFLDVNLRTFCESEPSTEDLYEKLKARMSELQQLSQEPKRAAVLRKLSILRNVDQKEAKLSIMSQDPGRLTKAGFAGRLKEEEQLRNYITVNKAKTSAALEALVEDWKSDHPDETFYITGIEISQRLAQEAAKSVNRRISISRKRPRPRSANLTMMNKRPRPILSNPERPNPRPLEQRQPLNRVRCVDNESASAPSAISIMSLPPSASRTSSATSSTAAVIPKVRPLSFADPATLRNKRLPASKIPSTSNSPLKSVRSAPNSVAVTKASPSSSPFSSSNSSSSASSSRLRQNIAPERPLIYTRNADIVAHSISAPRRVLKTMPKGAAPNQAIKYKDIPTNKSTGIVQSQRLGNSNRRTAQTAVPHIKRLSHAESLRVPLDTLGNSKLNRVNAIRSLHGKSSSARSEHDRSSCRENPVSPLPEAQNATETRNADEVHTEQHSDGADVGDSYFDELHSSFYQPHHSFLRSEL